MCEVYLCLCDLSLDSSTEFKFETECCLTLQHKNYKKLKKFAEFETHTDNMSGQEHRM